MRFTNRNHGAGNEPGQDRNDDQGYQSPERQGCRSEIKGFGEYDFAQAVCRWAFEFGREQFTRFPECQKLQGNPVR